MGQKLGKQALKEVAKIVTPDTMLSRAACQAAARQWLPKGTSFLWRCVVRHVVRGDDLRRPARY